LKPFRTRGQIPKLEDDCTMHQKKSCTMHQICVPLSQNVAEILFQHANCDENFKSSNFSEKIIK